MPDHETPTPPIMSEAGYEPLARILLGAYNQSAKGKGRIRHANDKPFDKQPIMEIARMVGLGGHTYQVCKKAQEATGMAARGDYDAALAEFRGVIVYAAAAILLTEENKAMAENPLMTHDPNIRTRESILTEAEIDVVAVTAEDMVEWTSQDGGIEEGGPISNGARKTFTNTPSMASGGFVPRSDQMDRG